jgi:hypothetical protein
MKIINGILSLPYVSEERNGTQSEYTHKHEKKINQSINND